MKLSQPNHLLCRVIIVVTLLTGSPFVQAGWFYFDPITGSAAIRFDGNQTRTRTGSTTTYLILEEQLRIKQDGFVIDPRIGNFSVELIPVFWQGKTTSASNKSTFNNRALNYNINVGILQGSNSPYNASVSSGRRSSPTCPRSRPWRW